MADIFTPGMRDWLDKLNQLAEGQLLPIQPDWNAAPGSVKEIKNKPTLAAVATSGSKADVGLSKVDNTSDAEKPVSTAQQAALDLKASKGSKADAGLPNADNTSDVNKPISTATAIALAGKQANLGYVPVQQGGGPGQINNKVNIGWSIGNSLKLSIDSTDLGSFITTKTVAAAPLEDTLVTQLLYPNVDNTYSLGLASRRYNTLYSATGTINTSDATHKTPVAELSVAQLAAAKDLAAEIGSYKFLDAVAAKGSAARMHIGMTVQRAIEVMESHGLDPFTYGFICFDEWDEQAIERPAVEGEDGTLVAEAYTEILPAGSIYSFRTDEFNAFIAAGLAARQTAIEARLAALESAAL